MQECSLQTGGLVISTLVIHPLVSSFIRYRRGPREGKLALLRCRLSNDLVHQGPEDSN
jgi:hypothetical protein